MNHLRTLLLTIVLLSGLLISVANPTPAEAHTYQWECKYSTTYGRYVWHKHRYNHYEVWDDKNRNGIWEWGETIVWHEYLGTSVYSTDPCYGAY